MAKTWLTSLLEETMYQHYITHHPVLVSGIKKMLLIGESKRNIKKFCEQAIGKTLTSDCVGYMIDYVHKQIKN